MAKAKTPKKASRKKTTARKNEHHLCATMLHHEYLCATSDIYQTNRLELENLTRTARFDQRTSVIRIPVVVHILYNTDRQNISRDQIESQFDVLNADFRKLNSDLSNAPDAFRGVAADCQIEFALAKRDKNGNPSSGITRTYTPLNKFPYDPDDPDATHKLDQIIKQDEYGISAWPRDDYLNIWVCEIERGLLGYAQFPGGPPSTDGVVVTTTAFGLGGTTKAPFNKGRTTTHEIGHWLNLLHIWGSSRASCGDSDNVSDTPNQGGPNYDKPNYPNISCNNHPHGDMFVNYMDYVDDDVMVMFTKGQSARMNAALGSHRAPLLSSKGLIDPDMEHEANWLRSQEKKIPYGREHGDDTSTEFDGVSWK